MLLLEKGEEEYLRKKKKERRGWEKPSAVRGGKEEGGVRFCLRVRGFQKGVERVVGRPVPCRETWRLTVKGVGRLARSAQGGKERGEKKKRIGGREKEGGGGCVVVGVRRKGLCAYPRERRPW